MCYCPKCYSEEIPVSTARTMFACGSSMFDEHIETFKQSENCRSLEKQKGENSAIDRRFRSMESRIKKLEKQQKDYSNKYQPKLIKEEHIAGLRAPAATYMEIDGVPVSEIEFWKTIAQNNEQVRKQSKLLEKEELEKEAKDTGIDERDIKVKTWCSNPGQLEGKHDSVRIIHIPTGIVVERKGSREPIQSCQAECMRVLAKTLNEKRDVVIRKIFEEDVVNMNDLLFEHFSECGVRVMHRPTGVTYSCNTYNSLFENRKECVKNIRTYLLGKIVEQNRIAERVKKTDKEEQNLVKPKLTLASAADGTLLIMYKDKVMGSIATDGFCCFVSSRTLIEIWKQWEADGFPVDTQINATYKGVHNTGIYKLDNTGILYKVKGNTGEDYIYDFALRAAFNSCKDENLQKDSRGKIFIV